MCNHLPTSAYGGGVSAESHCGAGWGAGSTPLERVPGIPDIFLYSKDALVSVIIYNKIFIAADDRHFLEILCH